ncbi:hypothetical protein TWF281_003719 [Arthrobotrys megalospora]
MVSGGSHNLGKRARTSTTGNTPAWPSPGFMDWLRSGQSGQSDSDEAPRHLPKVHGLCRPGRIKIPPRSDADTSVKKEKSKIIQLLNDPQFSDLTVFAGEEKQAFHLHRSIVCLESGFFATACKSQFKEGLTREFHLPEINPDVFQKIATWMYDGGLGDEYYGNETIEVYQAADFLQVPTFREAILSGFARFCQKKAHNFHPKDKEDTFQFFLLLCDISHPSQIHQLSKCAESFVTYLQLGAGYMLQLLEEGKLNNRFLAAMLIAGQDLRSTTWCKICEDVECDCTRLESKLKLSRKELEVFEKRNTGEGWT